MVLNNKQIEAAFGKACDESKHVTITLPYPMKLAWDTKTTVKTVKVNAKAATAFTNVFKDILNTYGIEKISELGIDLFGGIYNCRKMRGGSEMSAHAYAIAIDLDPARNQLHETSSTARFARPEYKAMIDIFYKHGFISLGREKNYDWMHFQLNK